MPTGKAWIRHPVSHIIQHIAFWSMSFFIFLRVFKTGDAAIKVDYIYALLFHATLLPAVYINLQWLLPRFAYIRRWVLYLFFACLVVACFSWLNFMFFQDWSKYVLKQYFFISYFTWPEVILFFVVYVAITSLLKLSKSWFTIIELQRRLLESEKEKVQMELKALKSQVNPHFFFNTLNGIYSMSLAKDERLPQTVLQLSHLMRYLLYEAKEDMVPLEKEWQVLQDYISLQKIRSENNLYIEQKLEGEIQDQQVAPLLLITFLENAFKHGTKISDEKAKINLIVKVNGHDFNFILKNSKGQPSEMIESDHKGLGLENAKRRLELLYPGKYQLNISEDPQNFIVNLHLQI